MVPVNAPSEYFEPEVKFRGSTHHDLACGALGQHPPNLVASFGPTRMTSTSNGRSDKPVVSGATIEILSGLGHSVNLTSGYT